MRKHTRTCVCLCSLCVYVCVFFFYSGELGRKWRLNYAIALFIFLILMIRIGNHNGFHKLAVQDNGFAVVVVVAVLTSISFCFPYSFISYKAFCLTRLFLCVSVWVCVSLGHVLVFVQRGGQFWFSHHQSKKTTRNESFVLFQCNRKCVLLFLFFLAHSWW